LGSKLLQITTPATGSLNHNGFGIFSNATKEVTFLQQEQANFSIEGPGGGLTILPNGDIGIGKDNPQAKLDVNGVFQASSAKITGNVSIGTTTSSQSKLYVTGGNLTVQDNSVFKMALGCLNGQNIGWGTSYIGFNAVRENGNWRMASDGSNNGGAVIYSTLGGHLYFATIPKVAGPEQILPDSMIRKNVKLILTADGILKAKDVLVTLSNWPDFVFENNYNLLPLNEVEQYIQQNKRLPEVPSAREIEENGVELGNMQSKLLMKIEELMLYTIEQQKLIEALEKRLTEIENKKENN